MLISRFISQT